MRSLRRALRCGLVAALAAFTIATPASAEQHYPRLVGNYLEQHTLPPDGVLARYDVIVIDSEWAHRDPTVHARLRTLHPGITILAYVDWVDRIENWATPGGGARWESPGEVNWWSDRDTMVPGIAEAWLAKRADGGYVSEWGGTTMINLSDTAPRVKGIQAWQYAADQTVDVVWATGKWDGIVLDVWGDQIYNGNAQSWDVNRDGVNESGANLYGRGTSWERGINAAEQRMRTRMGASAILVANNYRTFVNGQINGRMFEDFDEGEFMGRDWRFDTPAVASSSTNANAAPQKISLALNHRRPGTSGPLTETDFRRARWYMTSALLTNAYWGGTGADYNELPYYDEYDGGGHLGRNYLGAAETAATSWSDIERPFVDGSGKYANGVYRRDFANGIALTNPTGTTQTVTLERAYRKLVGAQSPLVNDGTVVTQITIPSHDGRVLMNTTAASPPPVVAPPPTPVPVVTPPVVVPPTPVVPTPPVAQPTAPIAFPPHAPAFNTAIVETPQTGAESLRLLTPVAPSPSRGPEEASPSKQRVAPRPAAKKVARRPVRTAHKRVARKPARSPRAQGRR